MALWRWLLLPIESLLKRCVELDGSDLHVKTDTGRIYVRVHGDLVLIEDVPHFSEHEFMAAMNKVLRPIQLKKFEDSFELDFALEVPGVARFRGNMFRQRGIPQAIFRVIPFEIQSIEELNLPELCGDLLRLPRGLILVTGPAGSGKSTTLAAMIDRLNRTQEVHIMTVEDPVEFVHGDHMALINQREIDVDTMSFSNALKYVLRQDPDVILVGEMRDLETIHLAITAAETGHLVFGTLHTVDALQTVDRIVDVFPQHQQQQIRMQLSVNLLGVVSQTLVPRKDKRGRIAAFEVLNCTSAVRNLIRENKTFQISSIIQTGARQKMQTLDQGLAKLVEKGLVELDVARSKAKDAGEFMRIVSVGTQQVAPATPKPAAEAPAQEQKPQVEAAAAPAPAAPVAPAQVAETAGDVKPQIQAGAARRVIPSQKPAVEQAVEHSPTAEPVRRDDDILIPTAAPAPAAPASQAPVQKPAAAQQPAPGPVVEPLDGMPGKKIDPPSRVPSRPAPEQPKKKGFLSSLFGSR